MNKKHGVWASYAVAGVADLPRPEILTAQIKLPDGRIVEFFANRESGLIVVDVRDKNGKGGTELLRTTIDKPTKELCGRPYRLESMEAREAAEAT